jgi:hypothetical protein
MVYNYRETFMTSGDPFKEKEGRKLRRNDVVKNQLNFSFTIF